MDEQIVRDSISKYFPDLKINKIIKIGEGLGNVAFEINDNFIFRFPKNKESQKRLEKEITLQRILKKYSTLPFPEFIFIPADHSFVGYPKLVGTSMLVQHQNFKDWESFSQQLGQFLTKLHSIPKEEFSDLNLTVEKRTLTDWQQFGYEFFYKTRNLIEPQYYPQIELFFKSQPPQSISNPVLCHNDLGTEHILISTNKISGIIDWGGTMLADPALDFARIYRDLGEKVLDLVLAEYKASLINKRGLREQAIFYGKCLFFEDLFYGKDQTEYLQKSKEALKRMFDV